MALKDLVTLPLRIGVAATEVTLALGELVAPDGPVRRDGGYAERLTAVIGEGGYVEGVARTLAPEGPVHRLLAEGGTLDKRSVDALNEAVGPLSDLANRLPRRTRRPAAKAAATKPAVASKPDDGLF